MIEETMIVKVSDLREMNSNYDIHELQPYIGRTGIVKFVDKDQEEALVMFYDYCNEEHGNAEPENWFPLNQMRTLTIEDFE